MEVSKLACAIKGATPTEDLSTYKYIITIQYDENTWQVSKRYSEFAKLHADLQESKYVALPALPPKTLLGRPMNDEEVRDRRLALERYVHELLQRPDLRTSAPLLCFLEMEPHCEEIAIKSLAPRSSPFECAEDPRFAVASFHMGGDVLLVAQEDATQLARLGRMWTVVEPDELGALSVWTKTAETPTAPSEWHRVFIKNCSQKVRALCYHEATKKAFVGYEDGKVDIFHLEDPARPALLATLELHTAAVMHLTCGTRRVLSLGFDGTMRVVCVNTHNILSGGRLAKRLGSKHLTVGLMDDARDRVFLGTSGTEVIVYEVANNPPTYLHTLVMQSSGPVNAIQVAESAGMVLFGHGECVSCYGFEERGHEKRMPRLASFPSPLSSGATVRCVALAPEEKRMFVGYEGGLVIFSTGSGKCITATKPHEGAVTQISLLSPSEFATSGDDGRVQVHKLASPESYSMWTPKSELGVSGGRGAVLAQKKEGAQQQNTNTHTQQLQNLGGEEGVEDIHLGDTDTHAHTHTAQNNKDPADWYGEDEEGVAELKTHTHTHTQKKPFGVADSDSDSDKEDLRSAFH